MQKLSSFFFFLLIAGWSVAQTDIADARANFNLDDVVTVTGIVTNDASLGSVRYIQDGSAGIAVYPGQNWDGFDEPMPGDEITVTGPLTEFNGLLEVGPGITELTINSSENPLPAPLSILPSEADESLEGQLVTIEEATFSQGGQVIAGNNTYDFTASGESGVIYVRNGNYLVDAILPAGAVTLVGVVSQFDPDDSGDGYQILPRSTEDIVPESPINIASVIDQIEITQTSFTLTWLTDTPGDSRVEYGLTPALGQEVVVDESVTSHAVPLDGLTPGTVYYARVISTQGENSTESPVRAFATVSQSSGDILVYFNHPVDNTVATDELALNIGADMNDTIAAYITGAQHTVDIAAYNINNSLIVDAINQAHSNGVQVRYIAQGTNANMGIDDFDSGIPVHYRQDDNGSGMHNKFIVVDAEYVDEATVLTGSTNLTTNNLVDDPNNLIIFKDQSLARSFVIEFNEMWGSEGAAPDPANALFGENKTINTPRKFIIGGVDVELYFSPTDGTNSAILEALNSTEYDLEFALLVLTRNDIGDAIIEIGESIFINPIGAIEQVNVQGSEFDALVAAGIEVYSHQGIPLSLHHKFGIVDHSQPLADPIVITGSHNWSTSAETVNDENTVIVHDATIANIYHQAFRGILQEMGVSVEEMTDQATLKVYPNPVRNTLFLQSPEGFRNAVVRVLSVDGRELMQVNFNGPLAAVNVDQLPVGTYMMAVEQEGKRQVLRFVKH